jgi:hypothetical protein
LVNVSRRRLRLLRAVMLRVHAYPPGAMRYASPIPLASPPSPAVCSSALQRNDALTGVTAMTINLFDFEPRVGNLAHRAAYLHGYRKGAETRTFMSRREVLTQWPSYTDEEADCFLNGMDAGVAS